MRTITKATPQVLLTIFSGRNTEKMIHTCGGQVYASIFLNRLQCSDCQKTWSKNEIFLASIATSKLHSDHRDFDILIDRKE